MTCDRCGHALTIGEYPFCPHGFPAGNRKMAEVTWPGGKTFENGFSKPRTFYSPSEYRKALQDNGFTVQGGGEEGNWSPMSKEGLKKAEELVKRVCH